MLYGDIKARLLFSTCPDIKKVSIILSFSTLIHLGETDYVYDGDYQKLLLYFL